MPVKIRICRTHPRNSGFKLDAKGARKPRFVHTATKEIVPGVIESNKSTFYPQYTFSTATQESVISHTFNRQNVGRSASDVPVRRGTGITRGNLLDAQMGRTMGYFKRFKLRHDYFFDAEARDAFVDTKFPVPAAIKRYCCKLSLHARACWMQLYRLNWIPVAHQLVVGCMEMKRATALDLVVVNEANERIVIELKSGFNSYYYKWTGNHMKRPFQEHTDCVFNQHQLQLLISSELYRRSFCDPTRTTTRGKIKMGTPVLMRFRYDEDGNVATDVHPLRPWATDGLQQAINALYGQ